MDFGFNISETRALFPCLFSCFRSICPYRDVFSKPEYLSSYSVQLLCVSLQHFLLFYYLCQWLIQYCLPVRKARIFLSGSLQPTNKWTAQIHIPCLYCCCCSRVLTLSLVLLTCLICNNYCNRSGDCQDWNWVLALSVPVCHYFIVAWIFFCSGTSYDLLLTGDCACFSLCVCVCVTVRENYEFMPKGLWLFAFVCMSSLVFLVTPAFLC